MATSVQIVNPLDHPQWDDWMRAWREATSFHSMGWARTLAEAYGFQPCYAMISDELGAVAVWPMMEVRGLGGRRRGVSLPFSDGCGALVREPSDQSALMEAVRKEAGVRGWRTVEFRGPVGTEAAPPTPSSSFFTHEVDLSGTEEDQWNRCRSSVRRAARKARASHVETRCGCADEHMNAFYHLFTLTRRRHGLPPPPIDFFRLLQRHVLQPGAGTVVTAWRAGRAIAASIFLHFGTRSLYKYGASDHRHQAERPNDLVMWEGLRWCRARGGRWLSLGKTRRVQEGLRRFKNGWGAREETLDYFTYDMDSGSYITSRDDVDGWYNHIFRRMPLPLLRWTGRLLYHHAA